MTHLRLKCPKCGNIIEIEDTGERPLRVVCGKCGGRFIMREKKEGKKKAEAPKEISERKKDYRKPKEESRRNTKIIIGIVAIVAVAGIAGGLWMHFGTYIQSPIVGNGLVLHNYKAVQVQCLIQFFKSMNM